MSCVGAEDNIIISSTKYPVKLIFSPTLSVSTIDCRAENKLRDPGEESHHRWPAEQTELRVMWSV